MLTDSSADMSKHLTSLLLRYLEAEGFAAEITQQHGSNQSVCHPLT